MKARMYTTDNCKFCEDALGILGYYGPVEILMINKDTPKKIIDKFKQECPEATTVPQVFIDDKYIGGLKELLQISFDQYKHTNVEDIL